LHKIVKPRCNFAIASPTKEELEEEDMTNRFKQRIYRLCIASTTFFLAGFFLYDLGDMGIVANRLYFPCYVLLFAGILFGFKALDIWSSWNEDNSEDTDIERNGSNAYPITFYTEAGLVALSVIFLLAFTIIRSGPTIEEEGVLSLALFVAGACACLGHLSSDLP
jgi:hypothetical protein